MPWFAWYAPLDASPPPLGAPRPGHGHSHGHSHGHGHGFLRSHLVCDCIDVRDWINVTNIFLGPCAEAKFGKPVNWWILSIVLM